MENEPLSVCSADGTSIAAWRSGSGPALVLVTGALMDHGGWSRLMPYLVAERTVYAIDRRGRGASSDTSPYDPQREVEDLRAVVEAVAGPVDLFGHSSGAMLSLRALLGGLAVRRLILYEPPLREFMAMLGLEALARRIEALIASGDRDGAVRAFLRAIGRRDADIERLSAGPDWEGEVAIAHTAAYDARLVDAFVFEPERLASMTLPSLLLVGGASPYGFLTATRALAEALPASRVVVLPGEGHVAMLTAPALVAREVLAFLAEA